MTAYIVPSKEVQRMNARAHKEACDDLARVPRHLLDKSNPNHPDYDNKIFGYNEKEFLQKQYK